MKKHTLCHIINKKCPTPDASCYKCPTGILCAEGKLFSSSIEKPSVCIGVEIEVAFLFMINKVCIDIGISRQDFMHEAFVHEHLRLKRILESTANNTPRVTPDEA